MSFKISLRDRCTKFVHLKESEPRLCLFWCLKWCECRQMNFYFVVGSFQTSYHLMISSNFNQVFWYVANANHELCTEYLYMNCVMCLQIFFHKLTVENIDDVLPHKVRKSINIRAIKALYWFYFANLFL